VSNGAGTWLPRPVSRPPLPSTCHRLVAPAEPTNGLDSSTALSIMEHIVHWAHNTNGTVVTALQAPTPELVAAFDSLIVMGDGHVIYHGPVDGVTGYFRALGYGLPSTCDLGDWLAELATSPATTRAVDADDPACADLPPAKHSTLPALAEVWSASPQASQLMATPTATTFTLTTPQAQRQWKAEQVNGVLAETRLLVARQFKLLTRNKTLVLGECRAMPHRGPGGAQCTAAPTRLACRQDQPRHHQGPHHRVRVLPA
jgi:hypothetical protein